MRPYRFKIRLSSKRLNVTRFGTGPAAALRTAARASLGSASSDTELIEPSLMERLLSSRRHDCANRARPQGVGGKAAPDSGATNGPGPKPKAPSRDRERNLKTAQLPPIDRPFGLRKEVSALARSFRFRIPQPPAPRGRRDRACRRRIYPILDQRELVLFLFGDVVVRAHA